MTETTDSRRLALVAAAQQQWIAALTDLGGRNTLLYYKDRRAGTLDLADADPEALEKFLRTGTIRLTRLFKDADIRADAIRRIQAIYRKARELLEERGIRAGYLATGLARWDELFLEPAAPVLLRGLSITPTRARYDDFDLALEDEEEVNPVLLHKLSAVFGVQLETISPERAVAQLTKAAVSAEIPGFEVLDRRVIGTFTYAKLPMVRDMEAAGDLLADSDLVAAIAGDPDAQEAVAGDGPLIAAVSDTPDDDYSVLDADSSQRAAIGTVLAGQSLVIHGPPGTGKSQTIANLIAALVARGRKVLFVAEKRAAIDAVLSRLTMAELGDIVLDIHEGTRDRMRIAKDLGATLDLARQSVPAETARVRRRLADRVQRLRRHADALHETHEPWDLSAYDVQSALLGIPDEARTSVRLPGVERIGASTAELVRDDLRVFAHLGGFTLRPSSTPWFGALLKDSSDARQAVALAATLASDTLPRLAHRMGKACAELGLRRQNDYAGQAAVMRLFAAVSQTSRVLDADVWDASPGELAAACAPDRAAAAGPAAPAARRMGMVERRRLRGRARELWLGPDKPSAADLHGALAAAADQLARWRELGGVKPCLPSGYEQLTELFAETNRQLGALRAVLPGELDANLEASVKALAEDQDTPWKLPRLYDLAQQFGRLGLHPLLDELARAEASADLAVLTFDHAWYASILDRIRERDPGYAAERGGALDEIASDFRERDVEHLAANRVRVRRAWASMTRDAEDRHPLQARVLRKQAALRRGHLPLRRLLDQTGDVLFALKPCWAMSPLMVSQVLPAARLFDVVIFDEASQIVPADAIPSVIRAHQVVVAGDDHQLPPTSFFRQSVASDDEDDDEYDLVSFDTGFESVLDALRPLLPTAPLNWHYRSRDERLVAFSNDRIYGGALTTFPGVLTGDCLVHEVVATVDDEVTRVVELILEHARKRPSESLGVIALGMRHAERIDTALRSALAQAPLAVEKFFAEDAPSPFFIKNLERVQGDERDAIILSVGYGKHSDGRMRYQWGPLLRDGGERRLNVAATRAKHRLTLVSSFSAHDVDPSRVTKAGARMLAEYLEYAGSGGVPVSASGSSGEPDPFAESVRTRLASHGITVVPSYGVGGYRVDFAFAHPDDPSRMILAVEADGASYRDSGSVRDRDRLRKEHLERLGWRYRRLWSTNWFHDPEGEAARLREAYEQAVAESPPIEDEEPDPDDAPGPRPERAREPRPRQAPEGAPEPGAPEPPPAAARPAQLPGARRPAIPMPGGPPARQLPAAHRPGERPALTQPPEGQ
jgi:very-short-patch-repair endonuclease